MEHVHKKIDLLEYNMLLIGQNPVEAADLVKLMCDEAKVCRTADGKIDIAAAEWSAWNGFTVTDRQGRKFFLKITAEKI